MYPVAGSFFNPTIPTSTIDQKLTFARNYPASHLSMGLIHFTDLWFGLKTASSSEISDEVKYQIFFAAHAHKSPYLGINFGENSGGQFYIQGLKIHDLVQLYRILHAYHKNEKSTKGEQEAVFGHHIALIEIRLESICSSNLDQGREVVQAFLEQDIYHQVTETRLKMDALVKSLIPAPAGRVSAFGIVQSHPSASPLPYAPRDLPPSYRTATEEGLISPEKLHRHITWKTRDLPIPVAIEKMTLNALRSVHEHVLDNPIAPYIQMAELNAIRALPLPTRPLTIVSSEFEAIGPRPTMEDTHFIFDTASFAMAAVFDGHGGSAVAVEAKAFLPGLFMAELQKTFVNGNVNFHKAFEKSIIALENQIIEKRIGLDEGSTATILFINKQNHLVFTANLGDSEARIYTTINGQNKIIPLSCVRDWSCKFDATRVSKITRDPGLVARYMSAANSKMLRYNGINVSRALGDISAKGTEAMPGLTHKPKITMQKIPDPAIYGPSVLVIGCDGLWDYAEGSYDAFSRFVKFPRRQGELAQIIKTHQDPLTLATRIGRVALDAWDSKDNVSVLTLTMY